MSIPSLKDLKKLATVCRKNGITSFKFYKDGSYEFSLDPNSQILGKTEEKQTVTATTSGNFIPETGENLLTEEQLLFWSADRDPTVKVSESN